MTTATRSGASILSSDRQGFDRRWYAPQLEAVYVPTSFDQVEAAVQDALSTYGKDVKIVSGRHCYENFVYDGSTRAILDMAALGQIGHDPDRGYYVDAGCENWTVYRTLLNAYGKTLPAGSCYSVGAGGHITGGGYGLLSRLHGLTVDWLTGVDIVTWDAATQTATMRYVSALSPTQDEKDLFWALCGAGCGNFGVIARYWFADLPDAPDLAAISIVAWDWSAFKEPEPFLDLLQAYAEYVAWAPDFAFSLLKLTHVSAGQLAIVNQIVSLPGMSDAEHRDRAFEHTADLRARFGAIAPPTRLTRPLGGHPGMFATPPAAASESTSVVTYLEALQQMNQSGSNQFGKYKSAYMKQAFPEDQGRAIHKWLNITPPNLPPNDMSQSLLQVDSYGAAINRVPPEATAIPQRSSIMKLQYQTYWNNASLPGGPLSSDQEAQQQAHLDWINTFYAEVYSATNGFPDPALDPSGTVDGCYYNYPDSVLGTHADGNIDRAMQLYFLENFRTGRRNLVEVKARWDPQDYFNHAQSVPVA